MSIKNKVSICALLGLSVLSMAQAQYNGWKQTGSFNILTTPEGAEFPATAAEKDFPLLVRRSQENLDFQQAKAGGAQKVYGLLKD